MKMKLGKRFLGVMTVTALVTMSLSFNAFAKSADNPDSKAGQVSGVQSNGYNMMEHVYHTININQVGTTNNGYKYNGTLYWFESDNAVHGYYLAVQDANNPKRWLIKETCTTNSADSIQDIYGLPANGLYNVYVYPIDRNYKLVVEFTGTQFRTGADSLLSWVKELPKQ